MNNATSIKRSAFSGLHCTHVIARDDAVIHNGREYVPTVYGNIDKTPNTVWSGSLQEAASNGATFRFNEDQTEIHLTLPEGHKFGIKCLDAAHLDSTLVTQLEGLLAAYEAFAPYESDVERAVVEQTRKVIQQAKGLSP